MVGVVGRAEVVGVGGKAGLVGVAGIARVVGIGVWLCLSILSNLTRLQFGTFQIFLQMLIADPAILLADRF